jgi:phospholipid transport system transporter-binding protein
VHADEQQRTRAKLERQDTRSYGVHGAMTFESVTELWRQSGEMFSDHTVLQMDLAQVTRTDSAGLALLVEWLREASRHGGRMEFVNLPSQMLALAGAANLEHVLAGQPDAAQS